MTYFILDDRRTELLQSVILFSFRIFYLCVGFSLKVQIDYKHMCNISLIKDGQLVSYDYQADYSSISDTISIVLLQQYISSHREFYWCSTREVEHIGAFY